MGGRRPSQTTGSLGETSLPSESPSSRTTEQQGVTFSRKGAEVWKYRGRGEVTPPPPGVSGSRVPPAVVSQQALPQRSPGPQNISFKGWPGWVQVLQDHRCKAGLTGLLKWALNVDIPPRQEHASGWDLPSTPLQASAVRYCSRLGNRACVGAPRKTQVRFYRRRKKTSVFSNMRSIF